MLVYQRLSHIHHRSPHEFPVDGIPHLPRPPPTRRLKARGPFLFDDHLLALLRSIDDLKPPSDSCCFSMVNWYIWYICYMMKRHIASFLEFKKWVYNPTYGRAGTTSWNTVTIFHQKIRSVFHNIQRRPSKKNAGFPNRQDLIRFFDLDSDMLHVADRTATFNGQKRCHRRRLGSPSIRFNSMFPIFCVQRYGYDSKRLFVDVYMFIVATCIYDVQNKFDVHMSFAMSKQTAIDPARAPPQREGLLST